MGPESKIELGSGTLYFNGMECRVDGTFEVEDAPEPESMSELNRIIDENRTVTIPVKIKFKGMVLLIGFWPAVRWKIWRWFASARSLWTKLRTPIEDEED